MSFGISQYTLYADYNYEQTRSRTKVARNAKEHAPQTVR